jgi:hypothetical protein
VSKSAVVKLTENVAQEVRRAGVSVFSFHPGLQPIGLTETALTGTPTPGSPEASVADWLRGELIEGRGAEPDEAARWIVALAAGRGDALSGRHFSVDDDLASLVARLDEVKREDLYILRLRTNSPRDPLQHSTRDVEYVAAEAAERSVFERR